MGGFEHGGLPMSRWVYVPIALVVFATATTAAPRVKPKPAAPTLFPTAVGTTWVYRDGDRRSTEVILAVEEEAEGKRLTVGWLQGWRVYTTYDLLVTRREVSLLRSGGLTFAPPLSQFRHDLAAGEVWGSPADPELIGGTHRIGERDEIDVPAGRFEATPVTSSTTGLGSNPFQTTTWYSPGVGVVKADYGRTTRVLIAFYPGRN
jgi:hypothetical protein